MPSNKAGIIPRLDRRNAAQSPRSLAQLSAAHVNSSLLSTALRPSACPGLLRIVAARDGGICRIKLAAGVISADQARAVAEAAERYAGGVIEATNRANLQIRGIGPEQRPLIEHLLAAGLGPTTAAADDVRNLMLSPAAGVDAGLLLDTRPLAAQILATLQSHSRFHELSAKFAVQLDGGEHLAMLEHPHDLWLCAVNVAAEPWLAFGLAGCPGDGALAAVPLAAGHALVVAVLELFLDLATPEQTRMRQLLAEVPASEFLRQLQARLAVQWLALPDWRRGAAQPLRHLGTYPQAQEGLVQVGAAAPLGRLDAGQLKRAAQLAEDFGDGTLRLTPWQSLLWVNVRVEAAATLTAQLHALGLLCCADQALARLIACTGASGCAKAQAETKGDARQLAERLQGQGRVADVHLSGCPRSCAAAHVAPVTLLAVAPGHYDLFLRDATVPGFGRLYARNLTIEAAGTLLEARPWSSTDD